MLISSAWALVPVEGILMGEANQAYQTDPLASIFRERLDGKIDDELLKAKYYQHAISRGLELRESCSYLKPASYTQKWMEIQAKRSMVATLQYLGLDFSVKAIGSYAKNLDLQEDAYKKLTGNLIRNYCSKNMTVFSLKTLETSLLQSYQSPKEGVLPDLSSSPFASKEAKAKSTALDTRRKEFDYAIKNFRAFCSWGGSVDDYRMLIPYLKNPYIMAFVIENMSGLRSVFDEKEKKVVTKVDESSVQVNCRELVCREVKSSEFEKSFPLSGGSTGVNTDLKKLYCGTYREMEFVARDTLPQVREWYKKVEEEQFIFEVNHFISVITGVSDIFLSSENYSEALPLVKSYTDERWQIWSQGLLSKFSENLLYEESLKVKAIVKQETTFKEKQTFRANFSVTMGEVDRIMDSEKMKLSFKLKISKNFLRYLRTRWDDLARNIDIEGQPKLKEEFAHIINVQLKEKEKLFAQPMWNDDFSKLIVDELLRQILAYEGRLFNSYQDEMLDVPVQFSFGNLALGYLRYRADVRNQRLKLNL